MLYEEKTDAFFSTFTNDFRGGSSMSFFDRIGRAVKEHLKRKRTMYPIQNSYEFPAYEYSDLLDKRNLAMKMLCSAENSTLDWEKQYGYIEDIEDDRGYTGGLVGFTSATGDMLQLVINYTTCQPENVLAKYIPTLRKVYGSSSHAGLGEPFVQAWKKAAKDQLFQRTQNKLVDTMYFYPAVNQAKRDGLNALGQFCYFDAMVMHGPGDPEGDDDEPSFDSIRAETLERADTPTQGGSESLYLQEFLSARKRAMKQETAHADTDRVDTMQLKWLNEGNLTLSPPLFWSVYGDSYVILTT